MEQGYAIQKGHNDFKTGVLVECSRSRSPNCLNLANPSSGALDAPTIRQQYLQVQTCHSENIPELGRVPGAQHTCHNERFAPRRKRAAVAAYFVNCAYRKPRPGPLRLPQGTCNMLHSLFCILLISNVLLSFGEAQGKIS